MNLKGVISRMNLQEVIIRDSRGSCPKCSGMLGAVIGNSIYKCIDCKTVFEAVEKGYAEHGVIVREKGIGGGNADG